MYVYTHISIFTYLKAHSYLAGSLHWVGPGVSIAMLRWWQLWWPWRAERWGHSWQRSKKRLAATARCGHSQMSIHTWWRTTMRWCWLWSTVSKPHRGKAEAACHSNKELRYVPWYRWVSVQERCNSSAFAMELRFSCTDWQYVPWYWWVSAKRHSSY